MGFLPVLLSRKYEFEIAFALGKINLAERLLAGMIQSIQTEPYNSLSYPKINKMVSILQRAQRQLKIRKLIKELTDYRKDRQTGLKYAHWYSLSIFSYSKTDKISLVDKLLNHLKGHQLMKLNYEDLKILTDHSLADIYRQNKAAFDQAFNNDPTYKQFQEPVLYSNLKFYSG
ncbi:MAG: hypothetical protein JSR33_01180 [Proteobacteria bacterium]|nr:hypothetical protein [Pseudomonadota bacterium]